MTEYEIADLLESNSFALIETFSMYVGLMAAYLVAVYMAAHKLSKSQIVTVSTLYVVAASFFIWAAFAYANRAIEYADMLEQLQPEQIYGSQPFARNIIVSVMILGICASLWFVWNMRRSKSK